MPLTPAEVHNIAFKKPSLGKRGYDEEEVDAFLDMIEVELLRLIEENTDLRAQLGAGDGTAVAPSLTSSADGGDEQLAALQEQLAQTEERLEENRQQLHQAQQRLAEVEQHPSVSQPGPPSSNTDGSLAPADHHLQAVQMLALAQQTADQHLAQSRAEADRLVTEAQAHAEITVADADARSTRQLADAEARAKQLDEESSSRATQMVQDAEQRAAAISAQFEQRKASLERRIEELRNFEREYRTRLKNYLQSQLRDLDASAKAEPDRQPTELADAKQG